MHALTFEMTNSDTQSIFVSTACIRGIEPISCRISSYQNCGFDAIELGGGVSVDKKNLPSLAGLKCQLLVHNYFPPPDESFVLNLASSDEGIRRRSLDFVLEAIKLTSDLGCAFYSVHGGFVTDPTGHGNDGFIFPSPAGPDEAKDALGRFTKAIEDAIECAERLGVGLLIENNVCSRTNKDKLLLQTADELLELFDIFRSPNFGLLLDTGHLNVTARTFGFDRMGFIEEVGPHIRAFHIHDNDGIIDSHRPIQGGSWVLEALGRKEFRGLPVVVEARFDSIADIRRHVDWLKDQLQH